MGNISRWLDVEVGTDDIVLNTLPSNLALVDLNNDNEFKLIVGDFGKGDEGPKLKVFKGAMQIAEMSLPDLPLGIVSCYTAETMPRSISIVAVGFSSCMYIYRNMKLFYKYYLPAVELSSSELEIWKQLTNPDNQKEETIKGLTTSLKSIPEKVLSSQSKNFLSLTLDQQLEYLESKTDVPKKLNTEIACISSMKVSSVDKYAISCLVIGTEEGEIIVLDPQNFSSILNVKLCPVKKTPYQMITTGLYTVDFRITVVTREKSVCLLKKGWKEGRLLFSTEEHIIAMEVMPADNTIMVICTDNTLASYTKKVHLPVAVAVHGCNPFCISLLGTGLFQLLGRPGAYSTTLLQCGLVEMRGKKLWSLNLEHRPVALTLVPVIQLGVTLVAVALVSGHLHLYDGQARRDSMFIRDVVSVMKFGQLGKEEHVFTIITTGGNLMLKILKRTADFNAHAAGVDTASGPATKPWMIPKKSRLFIEQSMRERENATMMHETFQYDMNRLRLMAAKTLLEAHTKSDNSVGAGRLEPVRLAAEVEGLGPVFRVTLIVENTSTDKAVIGLSILYHVHTSNYKVSKPYIKVPLLPPGGKLKFPSKIEEIFEDNVNPDIFFRSVTGQAGERALVKVLLLKEGRINPVLAATVQMPPTDPMMLPYDKMQPTADFSQND